MTTSATTPSFSPEQLSAITAIEAFLSPSCPDQFFLLVGPAGTGKTFTIQGLLTKFKGRLVFTAPTNKATKVLRETLRRDDYRPECCTIYSLLGLRMEANGEVKQLAVPENPIDLSHFSAVIVDEGSMVNAQLASYIKMAADDTKVKFIFLGDPAQLPPVKEHTSPIWQIPLRAELTKVMRHDNQILALATHIRQLVDHPAPKLQVTDANSPDIAEGVWRCNAPKFDTAISRAISAGLFAKPGGAKVIAWRNATVERYNKRIRAALFDNASEWVVGDRVIALEPGRDVEGKPAFSTDDEGTVTAVDIVPHWMHDDINCWRLRVTLDDNTLVTMWLVAPDSITAHKQECERRATEARAAPRLWKKFWEYKELFHSARHGYAITAHRSQGSTYQTVFVDMGDILANQTRREAMRCLYVACSRPKKQLFIV